MNADEFKQKALEASKHEYELIVQKMEEAAKKGTYTCVIREISDGAKEQLLKDGYIVTKRSKNRKTPFGSVPPITYYEISVQKDE